MANKKDSRGTTGLTANLLPKFYQTAANKKFLQSTLDQLFQPGTVTKTSGFIGRENAKAATGTDNYVAAADITRQNYQLEPGLIIKDTLGNVTFFKDYIDYINQIGVFGGNTSNHARLNKQEFYSWDPHIEWDKFVNFQNYYWLPYGPDTIRIFGQQKAVTSTYTVLLQNEGANNQYLFTPDGFTPDPVIKLYKGQTYTFKITSPGNPFSIKTAPVVGTISRYKTDGIDNYGVTNGTITFTVPVDAPSVLYYQSETDANLGGSIEVFSIKDNTFIDVEKDFLGKSTYKLSNGTQISNGMKVSFGGNVLPASYASGEYYVEGVGSAIKLVPTSVLEIVSPYTIEQTVEFDNDPFESQPFSDATGYASVKDYITINRASRDHNPWSRYNRWFHKDVVNASATYNNVNPSLDQAARANRPIIEFAADLKLFNFGTTAITDIDLIDTFTTDVFSNIEGSIGYSIDGVSLSPGQRILVTADTDPLVVNKIYQVEFIDVKHLSTNSQQIHLVEVETPSVNQVAIIKNGLKNYSQMFWFDGTTWIKAQQKLDTNQAPLFDVVDDNGKSFGDTTVYSGSTFKGTKLFSYKQGSGIADSVLGFPLSYLNVSNIGDIVFNFDFVTDVFEHKESTTLVTIKVETGYLLSQDYAGNSLFQNGWQTCEANYTQAAIRIYKNSNQTNNFIVDIFDTLASEMDLDQDDVRVYINSNRVAIDHWTLTLTPAGYQVTLREPVALTDVVTLKVYSPEPINSKGHYEIPVNLQNNPLNDTINTFTLGEVVDHVNSIIDNVYNPEYGDAALDIDSPLTYKNKLDVTYIGVFPGTSNLRDLGNVTKYGTKFVQHSGPMSLSMYHITSESTNVIKAIETARDDYSNFKRNFISTATSLGIDADPVTMVDLILQKINANKPTTAPYYFTDMVPYGANLRTDLTVVDYRIKQYPLSTVFSLDSLSNKAVCVYLNGVQLVHGQDYTFDPQAFIDVIATLNNGDIITTVEYETTDGSFVPETPTKLGIWPAYVPHKYLDTTLITPREMIQGHDGSQILAYGDYRDDLILELEKRIFNNIKVKYDTSIFDIGTVVPSYNRVNDYSLSEFNAVLAPNFYKWTGLIGSDFSKPLSYDINNKFTYNYKNAVAPDQKQNVPGYWRGIYRWILDTDRPNICPWEMLGYSIMPSWWISAYGPAPYTSDNLVMWQDITDGAIREPGKPVVYDLNYAKPFLMNNIPVDQNGNLTDPTTNGLATGYITPSIDGDYVFGDVAPVESAWRKNSHYPFSVIITSLLLSPAKTFGLLLDRSRIVRNKANQLIYKDTGLRVRPQDIKLPNLYANSTRTQTAGIVNYVIDLILNYIFSNNVANYNSYVRDLTTMTPQLSYRIGAFTNKDQFNLLLESKTPMSTGSVFIPKEDYDVFLNTSSPVKKLTYSGVMITKLQDGYQVRGYSKTQPCFYYYNYLQSGATINIGGISQSYIVWTPGEQYIVGSIVVYNNQYYRTVVANDSSTFDLRLFSVLSGLPVVGGQSAVLRKAWDRTNPVAVPYGTEFAKIQDVVDFLIGYGEYLKDQGFVFDEYNNNTAAVSNWESSAKEFLFWTTQNWSTGQDKWADWRPEQPIVYGSIVRYNGEYYSAVTNVPASPEFNPDDFYKLDGLSNVGASVISLSPSASAISFTTNLTVVDDIGNKFNNYEIFKVNGTPIAPSQLDSYRDGNTVTYTSRNNDGIYSASFYLIQNEHVITINNVDIFNDVIYNPPSGYRRERIKVSSYVTTDWYGGLDIPGFVFDAASVKNWQPWQDYNMGDIIAYQGHYYSADSFLPGSVSFDSTKWSRMANQPNPKILPNWTNLATQFTDFYSLEVDNFDTQQQKIAQHLIGYQKRQYLDNIIQDDVSEFKFYQGMIREKGTQNVLNKLFNVLTSDNAESLTFYEEWALRVGQYGASKAFEEIEFTLDEGKFKSNPQATALVQSTQQDINVFINQQTPNDVYLKPIGYTSTPFPVIKNNQPLLRTAGYVNPSDVFLSLGTISEILKQDITTFTNGDYVWVAFAPPPAHWNVYRFTDAHLTVVDVTYNASAKQLTLKTEYISGIVAGDYIGITQVTNFNGFYEVVSTSVNTVVLSATLPNWTPFTEQDSITIFRLVSQRASSIDNIDGMLIPQLHNNELIWTDDRGDGVWASWKYNRVFDTMPVNNAYPDTIEEFGKLVSVNKQGNILAVADNTGSVITYFKTGEGLNWSENQSIPALIVSNNGSGVPIDSIKFSNDGTWLAVGSQSADLVASTFKGQYNLTTTYPTNSIVYVVSGSSKLYYQTQYAISASYDTSGSVIVEANGAIFDVVVVPTSTDGLGHPTAGNYNVNVRYGGVGYVRGQKIRISGTQLGGTPDDDLIITVQSVNGVSGIASLASTIVGAPTSKHNTLLLVTTTPNVSGTMVTGTGAVLRIKTNSLGDITRYSTVSIVSGGTGYLNGDRILISGSMLGGQDVVNDCVITVGVSAQPGITGPVSSFTATSGYTAWTNIPYIPSSITQYGEIIQVGMLAIGNTYTITLVGSTDFTLLGASANTVGTTFTATKNYNGSNNLGTGLANAGNFVIGKQYYITVVGTTNFTLIGASSNKVGTIFTATGAGAGTGVACQGNGTVIEKIVATNSTNTNQGVVTLYKKDLNNFYALVDTIISPEPSTNEFFGSRLEFTVNETGSDVLYISALGHNSNTGRVYSLSYDTVIHATASYNPVGSTGTLIALSSTNAIPVTKIKPGMYIRGTGFASNQYVVSVNSNNTITVNLAPDTTPTGPLEFITSNWAYSTSYDGTTSSNFGSAIKASNDGSTLVVSVSNVGEPHSVYVYKQGELFQTISSGDLNNGHGLAVSNDGTYIVITDDSESADNIVQAGTVNVYKLINNTYSLYQTITNHSPEFDGRFGSKVDFMNDYKTLVIYSANGDTETVFTFTDNTTFDKESTQFVTTHYNSGRVDIYDMYATKWVFSESLQTTASNEDGYGTGFTVSDNQVIVSAPYATDRTYAQSGQVFSYNKQPGTTTWEIDRTEVAIPDVKKIRKAFLYNKALGTLVKHLDVIDPLQGKIPGPADEEIRYKSFYDPAVYSNNTGTASVNSDSSTYWSRAQVGQLWWNLSTAKFVHSYFNDISYRNNSWNTLAPGASVDVYEWIETKLLPAEWDKQADTPAGLALGISGTSLYGSSVYSVRQQYNNITKNFVNTYYYWVKNKTVVPHIPGRNMPAQDVALLIANPRGQDYTYLSLLGTDSFSLTNVKPYLKSNDIVLAIEYWLTDKTDQNVHSQWKLISNDPIVDLPHTIEQKWFDSLCGVDTNGLLVPDVTQPPKLRYGIENRPRQSMFVNRIEALKEFVERVNVVLQQNQITENFNISSLDSYDTIPSVITGLYDQSIDVETELSYININSFRQAKLAPVIVNGAITSVDIVFAGSGYLVAPSVTIQGPGKNAVIKTRINSAGQITDVTIENAGTGYDDSNTTIVVRTYCILVKSDTVAGGNWSIYAYEPSTKVWSRILTQAYDVRNYWNYSDWYATGYSKYSAPDYAVNTFVELNTIQPAVGELVKIRTANSGGWLLLERYALVSSVDWTQSYNVVGIESGTIQLSTKLYNFEVTNIGYDSDIYDGGNFDIVAATELRVILNTIKNDILIGSLKQQYLDLFLASIRYAHSEQVFIDWAFKTSFVRATHNVGRLDQPVNYPVDNISNFEDYVSEVKPYRTKLREYISDYTSTDIGQSAVTDFDLQPAFQNGIVVPVDTHVTNGIITASSSLVQSYPWKFWLDNVGFSVVELKLIDGGSGYVTPPAVIFSGDSGTGATATAFITNGKVSRIVLITKGTGYLSAPKVTISGGVGIGGTSARAVAIIGDSVIRGTKIGMKFDRIRSDFYLTDLNRTETFTGSGSKLQFPLIWAPDVRIGKSFVSITPKSGSPAVVLREDYTLAIIKSTYRGYTSYSGTVTFKTAPTKDSTIVVNYTVDESMLAATDRINKFYNPTTGQLGSDLTQLMTGVDYGGVQVTGMGFEINNGWGTAPFYSDKWDNFDSTFTDYYVTTAANTHTFTLPYVANPGTEINIYQAVTSVESEVSNGSKLRYNFFNAADTVTIVTPATAESVSTTYTPAGSYYTTLKVGSTTGVFAGMAVLNGVHFASGQTVVSVVDSHTVTLSAAPDSTPSGTVLFTYNYKGSNKLLLNSVADITEGSIVTFGGTNLNPFAFDTIVQSKDSIHNTITLGTLNNASNLNVMSVTATLSTLTLTFATQSRIPYITGSTISVTGFIPNKYNGIYTVTNGSYNSVTLNNLHAVTAPVTTLGTTTLTVESLVFETIPTNETINFTRILQKDLEVTIKTDGSIILKAPAAAGSIVVSTSKQNPIRLDDAKFGTAEQINPYAVMQTPFPVLAVTITNAGQYETYPTVTFSDSDLNTNYTATGRAVMTAIGASYAGNNSGVGYTEGDLLVVQPAHGPASAVLSNSTIENSTLMVGTVTGQIIPGMILTGSGIAQYVSGINVISATGDGIYATLAYSHSDGMPFANGQLITVTGIDVDGYNGTYTVIETSYDSDTGHYLITYANTTTDTSTSTGIISSSAVTYIIGLDSSSTGTGDGSMWTINFKQTTVALANTTYDITASGAVIFRVSKVGSFTSVGPIDELQLISSSEYVDGVVSIEQPLVGGTGTDATITIIYGIKAIELTDAGSGYLNNPTVTISQGITVEATATASATIRNVVNGTSQTIVSIPNSYSVEAGSEFILRQATSDGSITPSDQDYDTAISGGTTSFDNTGAYSTATGLLADDIVIDGAGFVTATSSPATEEVVPGQVVDTLAIKVYDQPYSGSAKVKVDNYIGDNSTTSFKVSQQLSSSTAVIVKVGNFIKVIGEENDYTVDVSTGTINFKVAPPKKTIVSIFSIGLSGKNILDNDYYVADGRTTEFVTRAKWSTNVSSLVYIDGVFSNPAMFKTDSSYALDGMIAFRFSDAPAAGSVINYIVTAGAQRNFSVTQTEIITTTGSASYTLTNPIGINSPIEESTIVTAGSLVLKAPSNTYFTIEQGILTYTIPSTKYSTLTANGILVYIAGKQLSLTTDFTVDVDTASVTLLNDIYIANIGKPMVISVNTGADYSINSATGQITFKQIYTAGTQIQVTTSYNHNTLDIERTTSYISTSSTIVPGSVEQIRFNQVSRGVVPLERTVVNDEYVWVFNNSVLQVPGVDYVLGDDRKSIRFALAPNLPFDSLVEVITFGNNLVTGGISYMQFKDMLNRVTYKRLAKSKLTKLAQPLKWNDTSIVVEDASNFDLPDIQKNKPGVVEIRGERIEYFAIDGNVLSQLRRGTLGTGIYSLNKLGAAVLDIGPGSTIPYTDTVTIRNIISDGVESTITLDIGSVVATDYTNINSLFEVFVGGTNDVVRLKKDDYVVYDPSRGPYSPLDPIVSTDPVGTVKEGDKKFAKEFVVSNVTATTADITLANTVTEGTRITVVQRTGIAWDGNINNNVNILQDTTAIANFIKAEPGIWYTGFKD